MRPKRIIEGKITVLAAIGVLSVEQSGGRAHHFYTQLAMEVGLALVEWANSYPNLNTHQNIIAFLFLNYYKIVILTKPTL